MEHILSLSYGKDSIACIEACKQLGYPIDRIVHAEVWATDTISADLPPMVEFKAYADKVIKERYGIEVEHVRAKETYESQFYRKRLNKKTQQSCICGFPFVRGAWCNSRLKIAALNKTRIKSGTQYLGIASDEPERIARHKDKPNISLPLVDIGWTEAYCRQWCEENDLLSPIYTTATRGGCWFCHNQGLEQLRLLRKNYPDLWEMMLRWDVDSPVKFHPDGHTVHDFDKRFALEDEGWDMSRFKWTMIEDDYPLQTQWELN